MGCPAPLFLSLPQNQHKVKWPTLLSEACTLKMFQREVNLARTVATRCFSFIEKLGRVTLIAVFVTTGPIHKYFLSAYSVPGAAGLTKSCKERDVRQEM